MSMSPQASHTSRTVRAPDAAVNATVRWAPEVCVSRTLKKLKLEKGRPDTSRHWLQWHTSCRMGGLADSNRKAPQRQCAWAAAGVTVGFEAVVMGRSFVRR